MEIGFKKMANESSGRMLKEFTKYDSYMCMSHLARMIIINDVSFWFVEGQGLQAYSNFLKPRFNIHYCHIMVKGIIKIYGIQKDLLIEGTKSLPNHLFVDIGPELELHVYDCLLVDCGWESNRKIIKFV